MIHVHEVAERIRKESYGRIPEVALQESFVNQIQRKARNTLLQEKRNLTFQSMNPNMHVYTVVRYAALYTEGHCNSPKKTQNAHENDSHPKQHLMLYMRKHLLIILHGRKLYTVPEISSFIQVINNSNINIRGTQPCAFGLEKKCLCF